MTKRIAVREYPNADDARTLAIGLDVEKARRLTLDVYLHAIQSSGPPKTSIGLVARILSRLAECCLSLEILATKGRGRDVSVLLLNIFELRLDLQFIALRPGRELEWIEHEKENRKPWRVSEQLREICTSEEQLNAAKWFYRHCSMVKHGNPAGSSVSFSIWIQNGDLMLSKAQKELLRIHLLYAAQNLVDASSSAIQILEWQDIVPNDFKKALAALKEELELHLENDMMQNLRDLMPDYFERRDELNAQISAAEAEKRRCEAEIARLTEGIRQFEAQYPEFEQRKKR